MSDDAEQVGLDEVVEEYAEEDGDGQSSEFKNTSTGRYMSDWEIVRGGDYFSLQNGEFLKSHERDEEGSVPVYGGNGIMGFTSDSNTDAGTVIIGRVGAYCGNVHQTESEAWITDNSIILNDVSEYNNSYLNYLLTEVDLGQFSEQSAQPRISQSTVENLRIPLPPLPEQRKIASVLYNIDEAIRKTEEIIEGTKRVKKGVMQEVFTTGAFDHGDAKEVRLGPIKTTIPEAWDTVKMTENFEIIDGDRGKNYPSSSDFSEEGYCLFLSADNVTGEGLQFDETEFIDKDKDESLRKGKLERDDIIMTTRGTVGNIGLYDDEDPYENVRINSGMVILRPDDEVVPQFYYHLFSSPVFQKQISNVTYGTAQPQTSVTDIERLRIFDISKEEQEEIAEILENIDERIDIEMETKERLTRTKRALMQDLLTGEVRTKDRDIDVLPEVEAQG